MSVTSMRWGRPAAVAAVGALALVAGCTSSKPHARPSLPASATSTASSPASSASAPSATSVPASSPASSQPASPTAPASSGTTNPAATWPTYHQNPARTGVATNAPAVTGLHVTAAAHLDGAIYASPLVLDDATGDLVIAATENNTVYGLRDDGSVVWKQHLGTPVNGKTLPCGDIDPTGITGTPVYDPSSGLVFAVAFLTGYKHELVALNAETGAVAWTRPVDPPGASVQVEQQRGALVLADGRVWVAYGGLFGDCGPYHGYLVGVSTSGTGDPVIYRDPTTREGGFWAPTGPAADAQGNLYVPVGNGAATSPSDTYDMSDGIIELSGDGNVVSYFAPTSWAQDNARDYGTTGVVLLPDGQLFINGKSGIAYLLRQGNLGGITAANPSIAVCRAFGGPAYFNGIAYVPCTDGLRAVRISGSSMSVAWHATPAGSPIIGGGVVLDAAQTSGILSALDPATGATRFTVRLGDATTRFATPAMGGNHVFVGTQNGTLVVVRTS